MSCRRRKAHWYQPLWLVPVLSLITFQGAFAIAPDVVWPAEDLQIISGDAQDAAGSVPPADEPLASPTGRPLPDDPRQLGRLLLVLRSQPDAGKDAQRWWLQGKIEQRLHEFEDAKQSLARAHDLDPLNIGITLEQLHVALASGDDSDARSLCDRIAVIGDALLSASCHAQWALQFGSPDTALAGINQALADARPGALGISLREARITRAEVLSRMDDKAAIGAWLRVLAEAGDHGYARDQLARQLLKHGQIAQAERVTRDPDTLGLSVSRVIALQRLNDPRASLLEQELRAGFRLLNWRNDGLHTAEHVRFLDQVVRDSAGARALAWKSWKANPTPENQRVLEGLTDRTSARSESGNALAPRADQHDIDGARF